MFRRLCRACSLLAALALVLSPLRSAESAPSGPVVVLSGRFGTIWGDPAPQSNGAAVTTYWLMDDLGRATRLLLDEADTQPWGGPLAFDRQRVTVTGTALPGDAPALHVREIRPAGPAVSPVVVGHAPWIALLCKFSDYAVEPKPMSYFQGLLGGTAPGLDHYWREQSYNAVDLAGSGVVNGWLTLPHPRSYYVYGDPPALDFSRATTDCTGVADPQVYFPDFFGVIMAFNYEMDGYAWGGFTTLSRDGVTKAYGAAWLPPWGYGKQSVVAHETGHGFDLPHSSGNYGRIYDNFWDVMSVSQGQPNCIPPDPTYNCIGQHTIAYNKDRVGWIPSARKVVLASGRQTVTLERLAQPGSGGKLVAELPIGGSSTHFYSVEARRYLGYDTHIWTDAVIIHEVLTTRAEPAHVIDIDNNGFTGDAGAVWGPGEVFSDTTAMLGVTIDSQTASGFVVTLYNGVLPPPPAPPPAPPPWYAYVPVTVRQ